MGNDGKSNVDLAGRPSYPCRQIFLNPLFRLMLPIYYYAIDYAGWWRLDGNVSPYRSRWFSGFFVNTKLDELIKVKLTVYPIVDWMNFNLILTTSRGAPADSKEDLANN